MDQRACAQVFGLITYLLILISGCIQEMVSCVGNTLLLLLYSNNLLLVLQLWCTTTSHWAALLLMVVLYGMGLGSVVGAEMVLGVGSPGEL